MGRNSFGTGGLEVSSTAVTAGWVRPAVACISLDFSTQGHVQGAI